MENKNLAGSVMVIGAGIAGIQASLDLADSGFLVHLVEKQPQIGGGHGPAGQNLSHQRLRHVRHLPQNWSRPGAILILICIPCPG